jgi:hypothetical protein
MILYKYLPPERIDVLKNKRIRFTQPGNFNDPFEFRPCLNTLFNEEYIDIVVRNVIDKLPSYLEKKGMNTQRIKEFLTIENTEYHNAMKVLASEISEKQAKPQFKRMLSDHINSHMGILCLSEFRDSLLMWGHYTGCHKGFVIGFDSEHPFFRRRINETDEFFYLRKVKYQKDIPNITPAPSYDWFLSKADVWSYEKEWRMLDGFCRAAKTIESHPYLIHLFDFPPDAIKEVILGMRSEPSFVNEIQNLLKSDVPHATLKKASEDPNQYALIIEDLP